MPQSSLLLVIFGTSTFIATLGSVFYGCVLSAIIKKKVGDSSGKHLEFFKESTS